MRHDDNAAMARQSFCHFLRVRYSECDAQQVVFNAKYAEYVDIAATEFMRLLWGDYKQVLASGVDNQVVNLTIDWQAPARFDDVLAISVQVAHIGDTSFALEMHMRNHQNQQPIAKAKVIYVVVDAKKFSKMPIPSAMRAELEAGAVGQVSNHAGIEI